MTTSSSTPRSGASHRTSIRLTALGAVLASASLLAACNPGQVGTVNSADASPTAVESVVHNNMDGGHMDMSHGGPNHRTPIPRTASQVALYQAMQNLWQQHMEWTYAAVVAFATDSPSFPATADRLLENQVDIGSAVKPFYGDAAGDQLTQLLQDHINGAVAILVAAKAGDRNAMNAAVTAEYANAKAVGDFLATANPRNWRTSDMEAMMKTHIDQTLVYATDLLQGNYAQGITDYGKAEAHMIDMGNMLSAGIVNQFPRQFRK